MGVIALCVVAYTRRGGARAEDSTRDDARMVATVVEQFLIENPGAACPGQPELVEGGFMRAPQTDEWDNEYSIVCHGDDLVTATSAGRDGYFGTADDVSSDDLD
jgi:hypothetical protein